MVQGTMKIRELFDQTRPIDRQITSVINYGGDSEDQLDYEIREYEITDSLARHYERLMANLDQGFRGGGGHEVGVWVSGFYGSGKSSFTKYLGFALDPTRTVEGRPFLDLLCERIPSADVQASLRTLATRHPAAVVMLDLGAEQLADSASAAVTTVLYWKVLQWAGYSKEKKLAELERRLDEMGRLDDFRAAYRRHFPDDGPWEDVHNDPLIGVARADAVVPE